MRRVRRSAVHRDLRLVEGMVMSIFEPSIRARQRNESEPGEELFKKSGRSSIRVEKGGGLVMTTVRRPDTEKATGSAGRDSRRPFFCTFKKFDVEAR